jgi:hypothetical protein
VACHTKFYIETRAPRRLRRAPWRRVLDHFRTIQAVAKDGEASRRHIVYDARRSGARDADKAMQDLVAIAMSFLLAARMVHPYLASILNRNAATRRPAPAPDGTRERTDP